MNKPVLHDPLEAPSVAPGARQNDLSAAEHRPADMETARVLQTKPLRMALDSSGAGIAHWKHEPLHDVVEPMSHHVIMAYNGSVQRMERRSGRSVASGTFRRGVVIIIPEGSPCSNSNTDVSLAALASEAGLSRFHFCRAFKESTGLSPHAWLRQHRLEQAMNMLRDTDASISSVVAELGYASQTAFTAAVQETDRRNPERLAKAHAVAAIALKVPQSLWRSYSQRPLTYQGTHASNRRRQTMTSKTFVSLFAIAPRRRLVATAIVYGLSLAIRFTSATGEEVEIPPQFLQRTEPMMFVMDQNGDQLPYVHWVGPNAAEPIFFRRRGPPRASSMPSCPSP
jgi:AraC-like DNA-binding protein